MKEHIHLHRAYKRLGAAPRASTSAFLLLVAAFDAVVVIFHRTLLDAFVERVSRLAAWAGVETTITRWTFLPHWVTDMPVLDAAASFPSYRLSLITFIVSVLIVVIAPRLRPIPKVVRVYAVFLSLLMTCSAVFFLFWPHRFPYDVVDFSLLYMGTQLGMWLLMPVVVGTALAPIPAPTLEKFGVILATVAYGVLFGAVRYAAFLFLLRELTVLSMAAMFFALGPLIDFVYMVAIYSLYVNVVALRLRDRPEVWRWSF